LEEIIMDISASMVKELREMSGAGMMDCKKALMEANGNMDEAMQLLKEKGAAKAAKKSGRVASEGAVLSLIDNSKGLLLELNCETDFAAKSEGFKNYSSFMSDYFMKNGQEEGSVVSMEEKFYNPEVEKITTEAIAKIGENIRPRRFVKFSGDEKSYIHSYIHMGGKIGVLVEVQAAEKTVLESGDVKEMADSIAMQIASMRPECVDESSFPSDAIESEKKVFMAQVLELGKPENVAEKIVEGKLKKFISENTLLEQTFVMNNDMKVKDYVKETSKKVGSDLQVVRFARFELGEGIAKEETNFADEVAAQLK
jgi:elongation factor Ts